MRRPDQSPECHIVPSFCARCSIFGRESITTPPAELFSLQLPIDAALIRVQWTAFTSRIADRDALSGFCNGTRKMRNAHDRYVQLPDIRQHASGAVQTIQNFRSLDLLPKSLFQHETPVRFERSNSPFSTNSPRIECIRNLHRYPADTLLLPVP